MCYSFNWVKHWKVKSSYYMKVRFVYWCWKRRICFRNSIIISLNDELQVHKQYLNGWRRQKKNASHGDEYFHYHILWIIDSRQCYILQAFTIAKYWFQFYCSFISIGQKAIRLLCIKLYMCMCMCDIFTSFYYLWHKRNIFISKTNCASWRGEKRK